MDELIQRAGEKGVQEIVIGMAHRGRLNVLVNTLGKMPSDLFEEFEGQARRRPPAGDVKFTTRASPQTSPRPAGRCISLAFNPRTWKSSTRSSGLLQNAHGPARRRAGSSGGAAHFLVHGDAAFAGQGVVMETLNLAQTRGYGTHGTVHLVINNQIGFTTSDPRDSRSTLYSDVVKMVEAPVLHVNGDDPKPWCSRPRSPSTSAPSSEGHRRRHHLFPQAGHNEQDTPALTQPLMYKRIGQHPARAKLYGDKLVTQGVLKSGEPDEMVKTFRDLMDRGESTVEYVRCRTSRASTRSTGCLSSTGSGPTLPTRRCRWRAKAVVGERITTIPRASSCTRWSRRSSPTAARWAG